MHKDILDGMFYILEGHTPVKSDINSYTEWVMTNPNKVVAKAYIADIEISTVFLGTNRAAGLGDKVAPILFETMIFGGVNSGYAKNYSTWDEAEAGHNEMVEYAMFVNMTYLQEYINNNGRKLL